MQYTEIGKLIKEGKTSQQIRKRIRGFPYNPSIEYFMRLGYTETTAKRYKRILENNDSKCLKEEFEFIVSPDADFQDIIVDTCVFGYQKTIDIVENAKSVTILESILEEMDNKKKEGKNYGDVNMASKIRRYSKKFLLEEKYHLIPFKGFEENMYADNTIIQFLLITEVSKRPTILTTDAFLVDKAKCHGLNYILYNPVKFVMEREQKVVNNPKSQKAILAKGETIKNIENPTKKQEDEKDLLKTDKEVTTKESEYKIEEDKKTFSKGGVNVVAIAEKGAKIDIYNVNAKVLYLADGVYEEVFETIELISPEEIIVIVPIQKTGAIYINKIHIEDGNIQQEEKEYYYVNEIYMDDWISDNIKAKITNLF